VLDWVVARFRRADPARTVLLAVLTDSA